MAGARGQATTTGVKTPVLKHGFRFGDYLELIWKASGQHGSALDASPGGDGSTVSSHKTGDSFQGSGTPRAARHARASYMYMHVSQDSLSLLSTLRWIGAGAGAADSGRGTATGAGSSRAARWRRVSFD